MKNSKPKKKIYQTEYQTAGFFSGVLYVASVAGG